MQKQIIKKNMYKRPHKYNELFKDKLNYNPFYSESTHIHTDAISIK